MPWERPRTTKLYLHPPLSNRQITIWPDLKVISKAVVPPEGVAPDDYGLRMVFGPEAEPLDWLDTTFSIPEDGAPLPTLHARHGELDLALSAACTWEEQPITHLELAITNRSTATRTLHLGLMPRSSTIDGLLIGMTGDYYASYRPTLGQWDMIPSDWAWQEGALVDGDRRIALRAPEEARLQWVAQNPLNELAKAYLALELDLAGRSTQVLTLALGLRQTPALHEDTFALEQAQAAGRWQGELERITHRPALPDAWMQTMFQSLVCQSLQMLARTSAGETWPRQGGRYDGVWPVEAMEWLRALDRIGLGEWSHRGLRLWKDYQVSEGEDAGRFVGAAAPKWTNQTGGVLYALGYHLIHSGDQEAFDSWRKRILAAVEWIERQRSKTKEGRSEPTPEDPAGWGLFPAGKGHDWDWQAQYWCFTDTINYMGLREAAAAFAHWQDLEAPRLQAAADDYRACLERTLALVVRGQEEQETVWIPNVLGAPDRYPPIGPYCGDGPSNLLRAGILPARSRLFEQLEAFWRRNGWLKHGLTDRMTDSLVTQGYFADPWAGHTWYTSFSDMHWFYAWLERGERDKAAETLNAQLRYGMTPEFYMAERYADNDPTFAPWQPNASANGRTIMMLFDFYGEEA